MGKRTKIILSIIAAGIIILSGTIFGLAKTGVIQIKMLADVLPKGAVSAQLVYASAEKVPKSDIPVNISLKFQNQEDGVAQKFETKTDSSGKASFSNLSPSDQWILDWTYPGCQPTNPTKVKVVSGKTTSVNMLVCNETPTGTYSIEGNILDTGNNNAFLAGATIVFVSDATKRTTSNANGYYKIDGLLYQPNQLADQAFTYSASGYTSQTLKLQNDLHLNPASIQPGGGFKDVNVSLAKEQISISPTNTTFSLLGSVQDEKGGFLDGVEITVSCAGCEKQFLWKGTSVKEKITSYQNINGNFNFEVKDIENISKLPDTASMTYNLSKSGYFFDDNKDGINNDGKKQFSIEKASVKKYQQKSGDAILLSLHEASTILLPEKYLEITVNDQSNNLPLDGAEVAINIASCGFNSTGKTNKSGTYHKSFLDCSNTFEAQIRISKDTYTTRLITFDRSEFSDLISNSHLYSISLSSANPMDVKNSVNGHVYDLETQQPISNANVSAYQDNPADLAQSSIKTDKSGYFAFNGLGLKENLIVNASKSDYLQTAKSNIHFTAEENKSVNIELFLKKEPDIGLFQLPVTVLNKFDLKGINNATVSLKSEDGVTQIKKTNASGKISFDTKAGTSVTITATKDSYQEIRTIVIPKKIESLSYDDLYRLYGETVFIIGKSSSNVSFNIRVIDKDSKKPIVGAEVTLELPITKLSAFGAVYLVNDYVFQTDEQGMIKIPEFINSSHFLTDTKGRANNSVKDNISSVLQKGSAINIKVTASNYAEIYKYLEIAENSIEIPLAAQTAGRVCVLGSGNPRFDRDFSDNEIKAAIELMEYLPDSNMSSPVDTPNEEVVTNTREYFKVCYSGMSSGYYYGEIRINGPGGKVDYSGNAFEEGGKPQYFDQNSKKDLDLVVQMCGYKMGSYSFDENIFFALEDNYDFDWFEKNKDLFIESSHVLSAIKKQSKDIGPVVIIVGQGELNAFAALNQKLDCGWGAESSVILMYKDLVEYYLNNHRADLISSTLIHEYGHLLYEKEFKFNGKNNFSSKWKELYEGIVDQSYAEIIWNKIQDANLEIAPGGMGGHPWDNDHEMFASFFNAYFYHHDQLLENINSCADINCQNILAYMWELFSENVGKVNFSDARQFPVYGGTIGNSRYSFYDIRAGKWRFDQFGSLPINQKISLQYKRLIAPYVSNESWNKLKSKVSEFNRWLKIKIGISNSSINFGSVNGQLLDEKGKPVKTALIKIGGSYTAVTDSLGNFSMANVGVGDQSLSISTISKRNHRILEPSSGKINVVSKRNTSIKIKIQR